MEDGGGQEVMTTLIITLVIGVAVVVYFVRLGRNLEKSSSYRTALGIHGKVNRIRDALRKQRKKDYKRLEDDPRSVFTPPDD